MTSSLRIIVTGLIAQHPLLGGMTWHYLHYVLGLARLGYDVYYLEDSGEWPYNLHGGATGDDYAEVNCEENVKYLAKVMARFGLADRWAFCSPIDGQWSGLPDGKRGDIIASADLLVNVSGTLEHTEKYRHVRRLAYVDTDPVFTQFKLQNPAHLKEQVDAHDVHFSFGECLADAVPKTGHQWHPTRQPIVLSEWRPGTTCRNVFTTVMNWASYDPVVSGERNYGQKDREFARFARLPQKIAPTMLELAARGMRQGRLPGMEGDGKRGELISYLVANGWQVVDSMVVCSDYERYRGYIESSKAEWSVAKNAYVSAKPGWFSDRSACYLAAGRPVVVQDTGFSSVLPTGEGILVFATEQAAVEAIQEVEGNYHRHTKTARDIAEEYFEAGKILKRLVEKAMTFMRSDSEHHMRGAQALRSDHP